MSIVAERRVVAQVGVRPVVAGLAEQVEEWEREDDAQGPTDGPEGGVRRWSERQRELGARRAVAVPGQRRVTPSYTAPDRVDLRTAEDVPLTPVLAARVAALVEEHGDHLVRYVAAPCALRSPLWAAPARSSGSARAAPGSPSPPGGSASWTGCRTGHSATWSGCARAARRSGSWASSSVSTGAMRTSCTRGRCARCGRWCRTSGWTRSPPRPPGASRSRTRPRPGAPGRRVCRGATCAPPGRGRRRERPSARGGRGSVSVAVRPVRDVDDVAGRPVRAVPVR